MAVKKGVYKIDNGSGFDDMFFKTSEDMIVGAKQLMRSSASYRVFPPDAEGEKMIIQTGSTLVAVGGTKVVFPIAFPKSLVSVQVTAYLPATCKVAYYNTSLSEMWLTHDYGQTVRLSWTAKGF